MIICQRYSICRPGHPANRNFAGMPATASDLTLMLNQEDALVKDKLKP